MFRDLIEDEGTLDEVLGGTPSSIARAKDILALDEHCRRYIAASPFLVLATSDAEGSCRASPRGGPPGFVHVLDDRHLVIPDYTGNKRAEAHRDLLVNPRMQLLFLLPGMRETLRISGQAVITREPDLLASLVTGGAKPPKLALGITVAQAFLQCAKALHRSQLWQHEGWLARDELPRAAEIFRDHVADGRTAEEIQAHLDISYRDRVW